MILRVLPYPSFYIAIPALALVAVNSTISLGPTVQALALASVFVVSHKHFNIEWRPALVLCPYIFLALLAGVITYGFDQSIFKAGKLALFAIAAVLTLNYSAEQRVFAAHCALRAFLILCFFNFTISAAIGIEVFRSQLLIEHSIYSGYNIAFLVFLARSRLTIFDRGFAFVFSFLCGSTVGMVLLILAEIIGRRITPFTVMAGILGAPAAWIIIDKIFEARNKELTIEYLIGSDRGVLIQTFFEKTIHDFSWFNWIVGLGVGAPLHSYVTGDHAYDGYLEKLGGGAVYAFCLHNEALRILCDFGLVGLVLITWRLFSYSSISMLILLGLSMITNSYLYCFSGAIIASNILRSKPTKEARRRQSVQRQILLDRRSPGW